VTTDGDLAAGALVGHAEDEGTLARSGSGRAGSPRRAGSFAFYAALALGSLAVWQIAALFSKPLFLPPPGDVWQSTVALVEDGSLPRSILTSYARILAGWTLGSAVGVVVGLLMANNRFLRFVLDPCLQVFRFLPAIAILPLLVLWLGSGEVSKIVLIVYASAFVVALATLDGALRVDVAKIQAARSLGADARQIFWLVSLPATMPSIIGGVRIAMTGAFLAIVGAEMLSADSGLGYLIAHSRIYMLTPHIFVSIACLGGLGLFTDVAIRYVSRSLGYRFQVRL
jgi:NitT/TauT family transport system permease protein